MLLSIPDVLTAEQVAHCRQRLQHAGWADGRITAGHQSAKAKDNLQLPEDSEVARELGALVQEAVQANSTFFSAALPRRIYPPLFNCYRDGQSFGFHVDNAVRYERGADGAAQPVRTDLSATLFLIDPQDYDGGELVIEDTYGMQQVKLPAGHLVLYPGTSLHRVNPVTRGARLASFFWIQSMLREDSQRRLMFELDVSIRRLTREVPEHPSLVQLTGVYHNLLRRWADV
ncbi:Fe2+-dependent dioxygenase [Pseudoxanthomonas daejeonensis]|uniref:Fe2+-dependent dioxygenase n=1 Tax=Pseudoxanthomonas daejeonensis TaxID=266062 RepID=A0ABQ6Z6F1_9GAMM|nr:Fe2+-dependent dioxygenase [Pseudoxanthomonas daejeonensis]KAF1693763.1 Fe2+-dependent dioxygenase [Pseudoxanthomonas daejeonensis]UNK56908.1 Fe2+-dependent dioxygenase [Pseudoxanthomonas daejeonensis]